LTRFSLALIFITILTGCNYLTGDEGIFRDRVGDYQDAQILPPMQVPQELDSYTLDQLYVIPERITTASAPFEETPLPKPIETNRREGVIIQNLGDRRWIVIDANPGQVWPLVRDYWTGLQVVLEYENPGIGIMETTWLEVDSDQETRHKYRVIIEPGLHSGYSEIYIRHMQQLRSEAIPVVVSWPDESSSLDRELQIMNSLSQYLADRNDIYQASSASLLAGSIEAERKANIIESQDGSNLLQLRIDIERAWVQVRQSLERADVNIIDTDRDGSFYSVRFAGIVDEEDEAGFFGRIFGGGRDESEREERSFLVMLREEGQNVEVVSEAVDDDELSAELSAELLQVINDNLS